MKIHAAPSPAHSAPHPPGLFSRAAALLRRWDGGYGLFAHFRIGTRLTAMMVVAAVVAALLASLGIQGLATSNDSLRQVYEDRMQPMRALAQMSHLMLANRLQLQIALSEATNPSEPAVAYLVAAVGAETLQRNMQEIDQLWDTHQSRASHHSPQERALDDRFSRQLVQYSREAIQPAITALRALDYQGVSASASLAHDLYQSANTEIQALIDLQLAAAEGTYGAGMQRYQHTGWMAISALLAAMALLSLTGMLLIRSIVQPLRHIIKVFHHIEGGKLDTPITIRGSDEISNVMRALQTMQVTLHAHAKAIHQLAYYDPLTQLPNRRLLRDRIQASLLASTHDNQHRALLLLDLDNFKTINDTQGHEVGDQFLVEVAQALHSVVGHSAGSTISRLGGDEFVILLSALPAQESSARQHVSRIAQQLLTALKDTRLQVGHIQGASASIGICLFQRNNASLKDLLKRADVAMYHTKTTGRNGFCFFNPAMQAQLDTRIGLQNALHGAVDAGQFQLHYQLQVDDQRQPLGAEVLLRWTHPQFGSIAPAVFIPIAESSGLILTLGEWVLQQACLQLKRWQGNPLTEGLTLGVNVSARQFSHPQFIGQVQSALQSSGANPALLILELTESLVLQDVADTAHTMQTLGEQGVRFSLDDFGTGYASLSHLKRLPLYQLKIDGSFVQDIVTDTNDQAMVQTMIGMANNLGLDVIAEGVETEAQHQALLALHCPSFQGYLFAQPLPLAQFEQLLTPAKSATAPGLSQPAPLEAGAF